MLTRVLEFVRAYWNVDTCIGICARALECINIYRNVYTCIGMCTRVLEFLNLYWHMYLGPFSESKSAAV